MSESTPAPAQRAPEPMVYIFGFDQYVKIGFSRNFRKRRRQLQDGLPRAIETYLVISGTYQTEKELHKRFAKYRLRGEWFLFAGELADWIEEQSGVVPRRRSRRAENQPLDRLEEIRRRNANKWLDDAIPNPWDDMFDEPPQALND